MAPTLQRAGSRGFLQTVLRVRTLIIGLFLCCVALMLFQTKLVTVTEELNSRLRREVATLSRTLAGVLPSSGPVCDDSVSKLVRNLSYQSLREEKPHVR